MLHNMPLAIDFLNSASPPLSVTQTTVQQVCFGFITKSRKPWRPRRGAKEHLVVVVRTSSSYVVVVPPGFRLCGDGHGIPTCFHPKGWTDRDLWSNVQGATLESTHSNPHTRTTRNPRKSKIGHGPTPLLLPRRVNDAHR